MPSSRSSPNLAVIVRDGRERPLHDLNKGDRIAFREFDPTRQCYVFHVLTEVPASPEVDGECGVRGHRFVESNGVPAGCCLDCGWEAAA